MTFDFFGRLRQELRVTISMAEETVVALAERVNRKVQLLRLHWQASQLSESIATVHRELGRHLALGLTAPEPWDDPRSGPRYGADSVPAMQAVLLKSQEQIHTLKQQLGRIESRIVAMQSEAVREDLLRFTRDLEFRGVTLQYFFVARGAKHVGGRLRDVLAIPEVHVVGVIRGPLVLGPDPEHKLHAGDGLLVLGPPAALAICATELTVPRSAPRTLGDELVGGMTH